MRYFKTILLAFTSLVALSVSAQTVDEIVAKNIAAMGGKEKLQTLKTVKMSGGMVVQGTDVIITTTKSQLIGNRTDIEVVGTSNFLVNNTSKGWTFMPVFGMSAPVEMSAAELLTANALLDIQGPFLDYKEKGNTIELKGTEKVDGADVWNLKVTYKNGKAINYFIDTKTGLVVQTSSIELENGAEKVEQLGFADYKQNAAGYWFPYSVTNDRGTIVYNNIETNVTVDESIFKN